MAVRNTFFEQRGDVGFADWRQYARVLERRIDEFARRIQDSRLVTAPVLSGLRPEKAFTASANSIVADSEFTCTFDSASALTYTMTGVHPLGTQLYVMQKGAGQLTIAGGAGMTVVSAETLKLRRQWSAGVLTFLSPGRWVLTGDLELT